MQTRLHAVIANQNDMPLTRFHHLPLLLALLDPAAFAQAPDPLVGTFHFALEPQSTTHRIIKKDGQYFHSVCQDGKCGQQMTPAVEVKGEDLAGWFPPDERWKEIGARAVQVPAVLTLFYVEKPDAQVQHISKTHYLYELWSFQGQAEKVD